MRVHRQKPRVNEDKVYDNDELRTPPISDDDENEVRMSLYNEKYVSIQEPIIGLSFRYMTTLMDYVRRCSIHGYEIK